MRYICLKSLLSGPIVTNPVLPMRVIAFVRVP